MDIIIGFLALIGIIVILIFSLAIPLIIIATGVAEDDWVTTIMGGIVAIIVYGLFGMKIWEWLV
jgi:hypothetical protein